MILRSGILFFFSLSLAMADEPPATPTKDTLQQLLNEIQKNEQRNHAQRQKMEKKEQEIACNWRLVRRYEICSQLYLNDLKEQKICTKKAKNAATRCLAGNQ